MKIQELDPAKQYVLVVEADGIAKQDVEAMQAELKSRGLYNITVVVGPITTPDEPRYWGIYINPPDRKAGWLKDSTDHLLYYPSSAIAQVHLTELGWEHSSVREFTLADVVQNLLQ